MLSRRHWLFCLVLGSVGVVLPAGCGTHEEVWPARTGPRVVVTFGPLASFVKAVAGPHASVICLCTTTGPHDYQYNVNDIIALRDADLFLANGLGLDEHFATKLNVNVNRPNLPYIKLGDNLPKSLLKELRHDEDEKDEKGHDEHKHGEYDPHVWLGIPQVKKMVEQIRDALKATEHGRAHAADYDANAKKYLEELDALHKKGQEMLAGKKLKLVTFHESLGYFADPKFGYGIQIVDVIENGPGDEPNSTRMEALVNLCKKEKVKYIAVEPQYPKTTAATVLNKALEAEKQEVKLIEIDPLETAEPNDLDATWYVRKVTENLDILGGLKP